MTRPAERTTVTFAEHDDVVWAAVAEPMFLPGGDMSTATEMCEWFVAATRPTGRISRLLGVESMPFMISTALPAPAIRYYVDGNGLFLDWVAFSLADAEALEALQAPRGGTFERHDDHLRLRYQRDRALPLAEPVGLVRCDHGHGIHWYTDRHMGPLEPEARLGIDGELVSASAP